jgi:hypothetical protein
MLTLTLAPAANASFTGTGQASTGYSTATLLAPAEQQTNVTISCNVLSATITVKNYGHVALANYHELKIYSGTNSSPVYTGELGQQPAKSPYTVSYVLSGTWRVEIRGQYKVPNSTTVWTGPPLTRTLSC